MATLHQNMNSGSLKLLFWNKCKQTNEQEKADAGEPTAT